MPDERAGGPCSECAAQEHEDCTQPKERRPIEGTTLMWTPCCCFEGVRQERESWRQVGWLQRQMDAALVELSERPAWMLRADEAGRP